MTFTPTAAAAPRKLRNRIRYLDGDKLVKERIAAKLKQPELARKTDGKITQSQISAWECGRSSAGPENVAILATALGKPVAALMPDDLLARISAEDPDVLQRLAARGVVIEISGRPPARPVCSACTSPWSEGHKCRTARGTA